MEIVDTPTDKDAWQHFAENFRLKMAHDLQEMAGNFNKFGFELFQARGPPRGARETSFEMGGRGNAEASVPKSRMGKGVRRWEESKRAQIAR